MEHIILNLPLEQQISFGILILAIIIQSIYYLFIYLRPFRWKRKLENIKREPISIIICAKNEYENLKIHLPKVLEQNYEKFEVIVVNDCSEDDSEMLLAELSLIYKHLKYTTIPPDKKFSHGKKLAITIGMKASKYNHLVFIDGDCYPESDQWLNEISKSYLAKKQIVIGYGGYENTKGLLNKIIRFDTLFIAMQYMGFAMSGKPYMGVGRNLSYLKDLFFSGKGFSKHYHIISGDDDLFINENSTKENTAVVLSKNSFTRSIAETTWKDWAKQKKRHLTTGKYYKKSDKFLLGLEIFSRLLFYSALIVLICLKADIIILSGIFVYRLFLQTLVIKLNMNKMNEKGFLLLIPILDIILPFIYLNFILSNKLNARRNRWK